MPNNNLDWKKYLIVFLFTLGLFFTAIYLSNFFGKKKINELKSIQDNISIDILSSETQFSLLSELSCKNVSTSVLSAELGNLGSKIEWGENNLGNKEELAYLKKYYSLLQIKDYLLMKRISDRCGVKSAFILYFYTSDEYCTECVKESYVLSKLREEYPELRVYSFDYSTDLSAVKAMLQIYKIQDTKLPALVMGDDVYTGFQSLEELEQKLVDIFKLEKKEVPSDTKASKSETQ